MSSQVDSQISQLVEAMAIYSANNPGFDPTASGTNTVPVIAIRKRRWQLLGILNGPA